MDPKFVVPTAVTEINSLLDDLDEMDGKWSKEHSLSDQALTEHLDRWSAIAVESIRQNLSVEEANLASSKLGRLWAFHSSMYDDPEEAELSCEFDSARAYLQALRSAVLKDPHLLKTGREQEAPSAPVVKPPAPSTMIQLSDEERKALLDTLELVWEFEWALKLNKFLRKLVRSASSWLVSSLVAVSRLGLRALFLPIHTWRWARDEKNLPLWQILGVLFTGASLFVAILAYLAIQGQGSSP